MKTTLLLSVFALLFSGCASIDRGGMQKLSIQTSNNANISSTVCTLRNDDGYWSTAPNGAVVVKRDARPINVNCENDFQSGSTRAPSIIDKKYVWQDIILDFCLITCPIDGLTGAFYSYPNIITVDMSKKQN